MRPLRYGISHYDIFEIGWGREKKDGDIDREDATNNTEEDGIVEKTFEMEVGEQK